MNAGTRILSATERMLRVIERHTGASGGVLPLLDPSITFAVPTPEETARRFVDAPTDSSYIYGRMMQPAVMLLGEMVAALEGAPAGYGVASGLAAIHIVVTALAKPGDHIVVSDSLYGGSVALARFLRERCIRVTKVDTNDVGEIARALAKKRTRLFLAESVSNPLMRVADISALATLAHGAGVPLAVDNTFSPFALEPMRLGADIVIHSLTKYAGGYSDIIAGGIACTNELKAKILHATTGVQTLHGAVLDARTAHELAIRMQDMHLRYSAASDVAAMMVAHLRGAGIVVHYPGLHVSQTTSLFEQMGNTGYGYGGVLSVDLGSYETALKFHKLLVDYGIAVNAVSLGSVHTYAVCFGSTTPASVVSGEFRPNPPGLIRIAAGRSPEPQVIASRLSEMLATRAWE